MNYIMSYMVVNAKEGKKGKRESKEDEKSRL